MDFIFRVEQADDSIIKFQHISLFGSIELTKSFEFRNKNEAIFGSVLPLTVPEVESCKVNIGFHNLEKKKWFFRKDSNSRTKKYAYLWIFKFDQLKDINPKEFKGMQSLPVSFRNEQIINAGNCYLKINSE